MTQSPSLKRNGTFGANSEHVSVGEQGLADVTVTLVEETGLEQHFLATEAHGAISDEVSVWELEGKRPANANPLEHGRAAPHRRGNTTDPTATKCKNVHIRIPDTEGCQDSGLGPFKRQVVAELSGTHEAPVRRTRPEPKCRPNGNVGKEYHTVVNNSQFQNASEL